MPPSCLAAEERGERVTSGKALVLGDDTRSFLATVRSLGRQGIEVHAAPANFRAPTLRSRYIAAVHDLQPWMGDDAAWLRAMEALLSAERFDLVIPCNETTLLPLQRHRTQLEPLARLAIPDDHAIAVLFDKHATRELARQIGVPVAAGRPVRPDDTAASVLAEFGVPVMVKPRRSYTLETLGSRGKARLVRDVDTLTKVLREADPDETLLEQFFIGQGVGVSLLASKGRVLQAFEHHRVRELAGASFYRISAPLTPELVRACEAIVAAVPYTGVAMFEFKRNESGDWILLEVNARPWGSMPLPLALGVDFPYRWYRLLTAGEETPAVEYRAGVYGRNLMPDLYASRAEASELRLGPVRTVWFMAGRGVELLRVLTGREIHDVLVRDDPRPGLAELQEAGAAVWQRVARSLPGAVARRRQWARAQVARAVRDSAGRPRVLFVCQGNICRSPFAASLLGHNHAISVGSAGMMPQQGRPTPAFGLQTAAKFGIDLANHRSVWLTREAAEAASLVVVFDETNRVAVFDRYPDLAVPVIRLDELGEPGEIADPVDGGPEDFQRCYQRIADGVAELARLLT
jgi:protein-tyrosine-phosphatase/predicted ATP-grasp superfamily ATP-dependent carboligase